MEIDLVNFFCYFVVFSALVGKSATPGDSATPEEVERQRLAEELLDAYDEAGEGLRNDK